MSSKKIQFTRNYRLFERHSDENRPLDIKRHKKLQESMQIYGFLACFPVVVVRNDQGRLIVKDGQHRLAIAEALDLPVYFVEESVNFDVAVVNSTSKIWILRDYAEKHASKGAADYQEGIDFADTHSLPIGTAFALLAGTVSFGNCQNAFIDGTWKIKDRAWADAVAGIYGPMVQMNGKMRNARFLEACMAVCRIENFDSGRLLAGAERCRDKLVSYSTRDAYLDMIETVYNFGRKQLVGVKAAALMALRDRNSVEKSKQQKSQKENRTQQKQPA